MCSGRIRLSVHRPDRNVMIYTCMRTCTWLFGILIVLLSPAAKPPAPSRPHGASAATAPRQRGFERGSGIRAAWKLGADHRSCRGRSWPGRPVFFLFWLRAYVARRRAWLPGPRWSRGAGGRGNAAVALRRLRKPGQLRALAARAHRPRPAVRAMP